MVNAEFLNHKILKQMRLKKQTEDPDSLHTLQNTQNVTVSKDLMS